MGRPLQDYVPTDEVSLSSPLGIVIDDIVYDCTDFIHDHPGGITVLESFGGSECSCKPRSRWQFCPADVLQLGSSGGSIRHLISVAMGMSFA